MMDLKRRLIALMLLLGVVTIAASGRDLSWRWFNYRVNGGTTAVFSIFNDHAGRTWLGTNTGIYLFNGYEAYTVTYDGTNRFLAHIYAIVEVDGAIFLGTNNGLFVLDAATMQCSFVTDDAPREIRSMVRVGNSLLIGSLSGLYRYNMTDGSISGPVDGLPHQAVYSMLVDGSKVYVGTYNGLCIYNPAIEAVAPVELPCFRPQGGNTFVNALCRRSDGIIYIGLEGGLLSYNPIEGSCRMLEACAGNSVKSLTLSGDLLVAGTDNGLVVTDTAGMACDMRHDSRDVYSIASNVVWSVIGLSDGSVWAGTEMGLSIADINSPVSSYSLAELTGLGEGQQVCNIMRDSFGTLWLGGTNGIIAIDGDLGTGSEAMWFMPGSEHYSLSHNRVRDLTQTSDGRFWVATDGGINLYDRQRRRFVNHRIVDRSHGVNANWAYNFIEEPSDSTVWIAGYLGGIFVENLERFRSEGTLHEADTVIGAPEGLPNNYIGQLVRDSEGNKWVHLFRERDIVRIDARTHAVSRIPVGDLSGSDPSGLYCDDSGNVWCAVYNGLVRISPDGTVCPDVVRFPYATDANVSTMATVGENLWVATGTATYAVDPSAMQARVLPLPVKEYSAIYFDSATGKVILGAIDEVVVVDPERLSASEVGEGINIFRFSEGGREYVLDGNSVSLPNDNRDIEIDVGIERFLPGRYMRFAYCLDNDPDGWRLLEGGSNIIHFTSLPAGEHVVHVALAGEASPVRTLKITVARPWYFGIVALIVYALVFVALVFLIVIAARRRQQRKLDEIKRQNVLSLVENRMTFLANISHDLKTPLSMIIGLLSRARGDESDTRIHDDIETAYRNALKLNTLVHQTIEINSLDAVSDTMLIYSHIDAVEFCSDMIESYRAANPERVFVFSSSTSHIYVRIDVVKLESLLNNLLSNAVKYSGENSTIACSVSAEGGDKFEIIVADDGVGIPRDEQSLVFQRLYRSPRTSDSHEGTGIGLYLVRRYAELLGGSINLESAPDEGSVFRLTLPVSPASESDTDVEKIHAENGENEVSGIDRRPRVLVVDDNRSIASFVASVLSDDYCCAIASNGKAGLTVSATFKPDLIIADEMMPQMSGLDMARRLKANPAMASVPIILLTANDTPGIRSESLEAGVDSYMSKPFEADVLKTNVERVLRNAESMQKRLNLDRLTAAAPTESESADERRLASVTAVIENNLSNPDLSVGYVCQSTGIASKSLYRLIKKFTGVSPVDYIRQMRLRKAAMLLEQKKFTVSEIMYMVGFSSSSYFSKCFSAQFGCTPGQYVARM